MTIFTATDLEEWLKAGGFKGTIHAANVATVTSAVNALMVRKLGRSFDKTAEGSETARVYSIAGKGQWRGIVSPYEAIVHDFWSTTNLVIKTDDGDSGTFGTTWASDDYELEPLNNLEGDSYSPFWRIRAVNGHTFPTGHKRPALQVTAAWGWSAVPDDVKQGALIQAARVFHRQTSPQGVAGFGEFGVVRVSSRLDPDVMELVGPYRHPRIAAVSA